MYVPVCVFKYHMRKNTQGILLLFLLQQKKFSQIGVPNIFFCKRDHNHFSNYGKVRCS